MPSAILTDGATFTCAHGGTGTVTSGIASVSPVATNVTIGGHKPILAGATVSLTPASGCSWAPGGVATPCSAFSLPPPSEQTLTVTGQPVYTSADAAAIALVPSASNAQVGLTISEPQTLVTA